MVTSADLNKELADLTVSKQLPRFMVVERSDSARILISNKPALDFTVRDCLALTKHPKVIKAATQALQKYGPGAYSTRTQTGTSELHRLAEARICEITGYKSALLFGSKNQAIWTLISCILDERDLLLIDDSLTAPYADAAHLVHCDCLPLPLSTTSALKTGLEKTSLRRRKLAVVSAINSATAAMRKIDDFWPILSAQNVGLVVDESLSFGVLGSRGGGLFDQLNLIDRPLGAVLDFSCLLGINCAAIVGCPELIALIIAHSRTLSNELAVAPQLCATLIQTLDLCELAIAERQKLTELVEQLYLGLQAQGWGDLVRPDTPIINLKFSSLPKASEFQSALLDKGLVCELIPALTTRSEHCFLRFYVTLNHGLADINKLLQEISIIKSKG